MKLLRFYFHFCTFTFIQMQIITVQLVDETGNCIELCFHFPSRSSRGLDSFIDDLDCQMASFCTNEIAGKYFLLLLRGSLVF